MSKIRPGHPLPPETVKRLEAVAKERAQKERNARTEEYRRLAIKEINRFAREHFQYLKDKFDIDELLLSPVHVSVKKPKTYYEAIFEAAALLKNDTYLLDRKVSETIAHVLPEAARRARYAGVLPERVWYSEFSPVLQKRITALLVDFGATDECNTLAKVRDLIRAGRRVDDKSDKATGKDFPQGRFNFNGGGAVHWFGSEVKIQRKGNGGTQYIKVAGKSINLLKTLEDMGVSRDTANRWQANADALTLRRRQHEEQHEENLRNTGSRYD
ncbi:hypothetical protein [Paraburkholderia azotifigens]|uniref:Uncharacterized protein n=1 Tax=Paraburkholderia azotifigens TaxID=2057004 RepID=A0A5C6VNX3_9BURK|nr:hypothetical protein [Paraburkholderia azotifigens]TXC86444.1 hypothetical protein FRZ40_01945 [Paraburkholderia azotifigens]